MTDEGSQEAKSAARTGEAPCFRSIHYLGSKLRALNPIFAAMDRLDPAGGAVCDLFAGSGTVSYAASHRRDVIAVDIQLYSTILCSALLTPVREGALELLKAGIHESGLLRRLRFCAAPLIGLEQRALRSAAAGDLEDMAEIVEEGALVRVEHGHRASAARLRVAQREVLMRLERERLSPVCLRHFGGVFFSYEQAVVADAVAAIARKLEPETAAPMAALLAALSETVNTIGKQFAQPLRLRSKTGALKPHLRQKVVSDRSKDLLEQVLKALVELHRLPRRQGRHRSLCEDYRTALPKLRGDVSLIYADPPYTRDHYSRYYHVLETIALGDDPEIARSNLGGGKLLSRGLYRADRHQSDFCVRSKAPDAFRALFAGAQALGVPLLLSYSAFDAGAHPRVLGLADVRSLAEPYFARVEVEELSLFNYSKLNHADLHKEAGGTKEILLSCS